MHFLRVLVAGAVGLYLLSQVKAPFVPRWVGLIS
jgi:hypothetical protein